MMLRNFVGNPEKSKVKVTERKSCKIGRAKPNNLGGPFYTKLQLLLDSLGC